MQVRFRDLLWTVFAVLALHFPAIWFRMYHRANGLDRIMHVMGGVFGALAWLWLWQQTPLRRRAGNPSALLVALSMVAASVSFSYAWEIYEYFRWRWWPDTYLYEHSLPDTMLDIAMGGIGAALTAFLYYRSVSEADPLARPEEPPARTTRSPVPYRPPARPLAGAARALRRLRSG